MAHGSTSEAVSGGHGKPWKRLGDGTLLTQDADIGLGHILSASTYTKTFAILVVLTVITYLASLVDFGGGWNAFVALLIATVKASIVCSFFMHLKFEGRLVILYAIYPLALLVLFIGTSCFDEADRVEPTPSFGPIATPAVVDSSPVHGAHGTHGAAHAHDDAPAASHSAAPAATQH